MALLQLEGDSDEDIPKKLYVDYTNICVNL